MQKLRFLGLIGSLGLISGCAAAYPCPGNPALNCYPPPGVAYAQPPGVVYAQPPSGYYAPGYPGEPVYADDSMVWEGQSYPLTYDDGFGWGFWDPYRHWHGAPPDIRGRLDHRYPGGHGWDRHEDFRGGHEFAGHGSPGGPNFGPRGGPGGPAFAPHGGQGGFAGHGGPAPAGHPQGGGGGHPNDGFGPFTHPKN